MNWSTWYDQTNFTWSIDRKSNWSLHLINFNFSFVWLPWCDLLDLINLIYNLIWITWFRLTWSNQLDQMKSIKLISLIQSTWYNQIYLINLILWTLSDQVDLINLLESTWSRLQLIIALYKSPQLKPNYKQSFHI